MSSHLPYVAQTGKRVLSSSSSVSSRRIANSQCRPLQPRVVVISSICKGTDF